MAPHSITTTFTGDRNQGLQVGYNSGSIHIAPERPETPPQPSCFVPFRRDRDFVDRATLLDQIRERCAASASRVALVGLGGVGKSQLAIEHCYRTNEQRPQTWVFWVHASNTARLEQSFRDISEQVKVRGRKDPQADLFKLVHDWLRDERNGPWLLVLDNADDAAVLQSSTEKNDHASQYGRKSLSSYLPQCRQGSVLVTSRTQSAAMQLVDINDIIEIDPMDDVAARELLCKKLGDEINKDSNIAELAAVLDYFPLALAQAAAYIRMRGPLCSVRQYLDEYRQSDSRKTSLLDQEASRLRRDDTANNSVLLTWEISFNHIQRDRKTAADLLSLMSFFDRQGIQEALLRRPSTATEKDELDDDLLMLRQFSFIKPIRSKNVFEMHSLVQLSMRRWLKSQGQLEKWQGHFISNLCAEMPTVEYENWEKCEALFPHARAALAQRPKESGSLEKWGSLLCDAAWYAFEQGRYGEMEELALASMEARRKLFGEDNENTLSSMSIVGSAMTQRGKYEEAETMYRKTLVLNEKVLGSEHRDTLVAMNNLASLLYYQGKYEEAEIMNRQNLVSREKVLGPEHPDTLMSMNNLALALDWQGKYEEAEAMIRQALALWEKVLGPEHPNTLLSIRYLSQVLRRQGKYEEAEAKNRQTLAQMEKVLGPEHVSTLYSVFGLAYLLASQHHYQESLTLYDRACTGFRTVLGTDHPTTRQCWQDYIQVQLRLEQSLSAVSAQNPDTNIGSNKGKASRLSHALSKIGIGRLRRPAT